MKIHFIIYRIYWNIYYWNTQNCIQCTIQCEQWSMQKCSFYVNEILFELLTKRAIRKLEVVQFLLYCNKWIAKRCTNLDFEQFFLEHMYIAHICFNALCSFHSEVQFQHFSIRNATSIVELEITFSSND